MKWCDTRNLNELAVCNTAKGKYLICTELKISIILSEKSEFRLGQILVPLKSMEFFSVDYEETGILQNYDLKHLVAKTSYK